MPTSTFAGSPVARTRSRLGVATRCGSKADLAQARRDHAEAVIAAAIERAVAAAPSLTPEQTDRLAALLRPTDAAGGDAA